MTVVERYEAPESLPEVAQILAEGPATMFAGGTDVMPQTRSGIRAVRSTLININRLTDLRGISESNGAVRIGGLTSITDILDSEFLKQAAAVVVQAADCFAGGQVRNAATIGGNICNASPAGDMIIPLLLLDADVELASWRNAGVVRRHIPLCDFFTGPGTTRIEGDEILTAVEFPVPKPHTVGRFCKFGTRPALDVAVVSVGIAGVKENAGKPACNGRPDCWCIKAARVAFGAVAPTPMRGRKTEAALADVELDDGRIVDIAQVAEQEVSPISDVRASAWYRTQLIRELTERLLYEVHQARD